MTPAPDLAPPKAGRNSQSNRGRRLVRGGPVLIAAAALIAAGCASSGGTGGGSGSTGAFKIAMVADLTGDDAATDGTAAAGIQAAVSYVNAHGGVNGKKVDLASYDAASTSSQGLIAARQAIAQNPNVVVVAALSTEIVADEQVFQQAGVPVITEASPDELLAPTPKPWFYGIYPTSNQFAQSFMQGAKEALGDLKGKRIAFSGFDTPDVNGVFTQTKALLTAAGAQVVDWEKTEGALTSYTSQAQKITGLKANLVISLDLLPNVVLVAKALKAAGFAGPYLGDTGASIDSTFKTLAGVDYQGERMFASPAAGSAAATAAKAAGVSDSGVFFGSGWAIGNLAAAAGNKCGTGCSGAQLIATLNETASYTPPGDLAIGPLAFTAKQHYGITKIQFFKWDSASAAAVPSGSPVSVG
jgi:branched-chain amino acid transport system substrate-binding protein